LYGFSKNPQTGKRRKGDAFTSQTPRNKPYDRVRFKSAYHQDRYLELLKRTTWPEKVFNINPEGPFKDLLQLFLYQGWSRLLQPETSLNAEMVREFYANALLENPHTDPFVFATYVRGRTIRFDREAINTYLGNPFPLQDESDLDAFHDFLSKGTFDIEPLKGEIKKTILLEGKNYDVSDVGREYGARYKFITNPARLILKLILYNIKPNSHLSDCTVDVFPLIYDILKGIKFNIAQTIA